MDSHTLNTIGIPIICFNPGSLKISHVNSSAIKILSFPSDQIEGKRIDHFLKNISPISEKSLLSDVSFEDQLTLNAKESIPVIVSISFESNQKAILSLTDISLIKRREQKQKQEKNELREFFNNIPVAAYRNTGGPDGKFLLSNPAHWKLFNCKSFDEFEGLSVSETYQFPEEREKVITELKEKGYVQQKEIRLKTNDKKPFWGAITTQAIYDNDHNFKYFDGIIEDITLRKQNDEIMKTMYEISNAVNSTENLDDLYGFIYESLNQLITLPNFIISVFNKEENSLLFPFYIDEFDSKENINFYVEDIDDCGYLCIEVIKSKKPVYYTQQMLLERNRKNKMVGTAPAIWIGLPLLIQDEVIGTITIQHYTDPNYFTKKTLDLFISVSDQIALAIDRKKAQETIIEQKNTLEITVSKRTQELKRAMLKLSESEKRFRETIELLPEVVFETDEKFVLTYANQKAFDSFQYTQEDFKNGISAIDIVAKVDQHRAMENIIKVTTGELIDPPEYLVTRKDGTTFPAIINSMPIFKKNTCSGLRGVIIDITGQKIAQAEREARIGTSKEMEIAKNIQTSLLPSLEPFQKDQFEISANMTPAQEVGGDYYDLIHSIDDKLWVGIGDVTGHGLISGLIMMMVQVSVNTLIRSIPGLSPVDVLAHANKIIHSNIRDGLKVDHHMTINFLVEENEGHFKYAGAHEIILIYRAATKTIDQIPTRGMWLGIIPDIKNPTAKFAGEFYLNKNDLLFLYTDGVIEIFNKKQEQYDIQRLENFLTINGHKKTEAIKSILLKELNQFMDKQMDDITFLMLKKIN